MGMDRRQFVDRSALLAAALSINASQWPVKAWAAEPANHQRVPPNNVVAGMIHASRNFGSSRSNIEWKGFPVGPP